MEADTETLVISISDYPKAETGHAHASATNAG